MLHLGLQLAQQTPVDRINSNDEDPKWELTQSGQNYFSKQFTNLFKRVEKIRNYKVQAEIFEKLTPVQEKCQRVPIKLLLCERLDHKKNPVKNVHVAKDRTNRIAESAVPYHNSNYGASIKPSETFVSAGRIFRTVTAFTK